MVVHGGNENGQRVKTAEEREEDDLNAAIAASLADSKHLHHKDQGKEKENEMEKAGKKAHRFSFLSRKKASLLKSPPRAPAKILNIRTRKTFPLPRMSHLVKQPPKKTI
jgi:hypothetical protein